MNLRTRLVLAAAYLLVVVLIALEVPLARSLERNSIAQLQSTEVGFAGLLASQISDPVEEAGTRGTEASPPARALLGPVERTIATLRDRAEVMARVLVVDAALRVLLDSSGEVDTGVTLDISERPEFASALRGDIDSRRRPSSDEGEDLLLVTVPILQGGRVVGMVRLSEPLSSVLASVHRAWIGLALVGVAALLVGLALAWVLATSLVRPVQRLEETAGRLGAGDLGARSAAGGPGELGSLAASFNAMADRLSASIEAQRDFVANASHQLRTPLTSLRLRLEGIRAEGGPQAEQAAKAEAEVGRLGALVDDLLELARAASLGETTPSRVELGAAARTAVDRWAAASARAGKSISFEARPGSPASSVWAAPADVEQVLDNLIENAIRYCPPGTTIRVEAGSERDRGLLAVADDGPGIPPEDRSRVFERFYRGSNGRRAGAGTGLGLAIVGELVERWGGEVRLANGLGTRVEATFPPPPTVP